METPIITLKGKELISTALGSNNKLMLSKIGFGDKATNPTRIFTESSTALVNERFRINLDEVFYPGFDGDNNAILRIVANVTTEQMNSIDSMTIREFAIYDINNNIFMIGNTVATLNKENGNSVGISFEVNVALPTSEKLVNIVYSSKAGEFTEAYKIKINSVDEGATKNKTDAFLLDRINHTGKQAINTITDLESILTTLNNKINSNVSPFKGIYANLTNFKIENTKYPAGEEPEDGNVTDSLPNDNFYNLETGSLYYFTMDGIWVDGNDKIKVKFDEIATVLTNVNNNLETVNEALENGKFLGAYDNLIDIPTSVPVLDNEDNPVFDNEGNPLTTAIIVNSYAIVKNLKSLAYFDGTSWIVIDNFIVDDLVTEESTKPLSAKQGKILKGYIDTINTILTSDKTNLDTLQEIVDFILLNKGELDNLGISNIAGLQTALTDAASRADWNNVTNKPTFKTINNQSITGTGDIKVTEEPLKGIREYRHLMTNGVIDLNKGNVFTKTITGDTTFSVANIMSSPTEDIVNSFILEIINSGNGIITLWDNIKWENGTPPLLTATGKDILGFYTYDNGANWQGIVMSKDSK